mgnify:CR=1 FL=1
MQILIATFFAGVILFFTFFFFSNSIKIAYRLDKILRKKSAKIPVAITIVDEDKNLLEFTLDSEVRNHLELGKELILINGLRHQEISQFPLLMDLERRYSFRLRKKSFIEWKKILPEIKKVFTNYFGPVEFLGDFPDTKAKKKRVKVLP